MRFLGNLESTIEQKSEDNTVFCVAKRKDVELDIRQDDNMDEELSYAESTHGKVSAIDDN